MFGAVRVKSAGVVNAAWASKPGVVALPAALTE
jgi:hypothetical protein